MESGWAGRQASRQASRAFHPSDRSDCQQRQAGGWANERTSALAGSGGRASRAGTQNETPRRGLRERRGGPLTLHGDGCTRLCLTPYTRCCTHPHTPSRLAGRQQTYPPTHSPCKAANEGAFPFALISLLEGAAVEGFVSLPPLFRLAGPHSGPSAPAVRPSYFVPPPLRQENVELAREEARERESHRVRERERETDQATERRSDGRSDGRRLDRPSVSRSVRAPTFLYTERASELGTEEAGRPAAE